MVGRGKVEPFDGDLDDYQKYLLEESKRLKEEAKNAVRDTAEVVLTTEVPVPAPDTAPLVSPTTTSNTTAISSAEQRKLDAQKRQLLAAQTRPLKRELEQNEHRMAIIEAEKGQLEQLLTTQLPPAEIAEAGRRLKALADEVSTLEERWLELSSLLEEATST